MVGSPEMLRTQVTLTEHTLIMNISAWPPTHGDVAIPERRRSEIAVKDGTKLGRSSRSRLLNETITKSLHECSQADW